MLARLTPFLALLTVAAACTADPKPATFNPGAPVPSASGPAFHEPADYSFVADRSCAGGDSEGRYQVLVTNRQVVGADRIDGTTAEGEEEIEIPTLAGLMEIAQTTLDDGGAATTLVDPKDGHPVAITFNTSENAADATCFVISDYKPSS